MPASFRLQFLQAHRQAQDDLTAGLNIVAAGLAQDVTRLYTDSLHQQGANMRPDLLNAPLPADLIPRILESWYRRIDDFFLGPTRVPIYDQATGEIAVNSQFVRLIWPHMLQAAKLGRQRQRNVIARQLQNHPDLHDAYMPLFDKATSVIVTELWHDERVIPFLVAEIAEDEQRALAFYSPPHRWVKPDGYRLSDRVWNTDQETRVKLDAFLHDAVRNGMSSVDIARDVERFLQPGVGLTRTRKPYGRNLSYAAMRLARTEISAAYAQADMAAARANPFVTQYQPKRTSGGKPCDICDPIVDAGPYDIQDDTGVPPFHPNCMDTVYMIMQEDTADVIERLRAELKDQHPDLFDAQGAMNLAHRVRVNASKWVPGEIGVKDAQLVRSVLGDETIPLKSSLTTTYAGEWEGDLYITRQGFHGDATEFQATAYIESPRLTWFDQFQGGATTGYSSPSGAQKLLRYRAKLNVADRATFERLAQQAAEEATKLYTGPLHNHQEYEMFSQLVREQFEKLAREQGIDAFAYQRDNLLVIAKEKVLFKQAYTSQEFLALSRPGSPLGLTEAMQGAQERFGDLKATLDTLLPDYHPLVERHAQLKDEIMAIYEQERQAAQAYETTRDQATLEAYRQAIRDSDTIRGRYEAVQAQLDDVKRQFQQQLFTAIPTGSDLTFDTTWQKGVRSGKTHARFQEGFDFLSRVINGDVYDSTYQINVYLTDTARSYASGQHDVYLNRQADTRTVIHEVGHLLEVQDPHTLQRCQEFIELHRTSPVAIPLGDDYRPDETAFPGNFYLPYVAKDYGGAYTEVFSIGLDRLYENPVDFYTRAPDHFNLIVGLISGWL
jgi:hypothetical protein